MRQAIDKPYDRMTDAELDAQAAYIKEAFDEGRIDSRFAAAWQNALDTARAARKPEK